MLDELRLKAIDLLIEGTTTKAEIAKQCGRSRTWLYDIMDEKDVMVEVNRRLRQIQIFGENKLKATVQDRINNIIDLATNADSEKVRLEANVYLTNRVLGNTTTKIDITAEAKQPDQVDFDAELDNIAVDIESDVDSEE